MTESSPVTLFMPILTPPSKIQTVGVLLPNTEAKIINLSTNEVMNSHQSGELLVRGPQVNENLVFVKKLTLLICLYIIVY